MGRPLKKKYFQSGTGKAGFQVGCSGWFTGEAGPESSYIISQRSNSKYKVGSDVGGATPTRTQVLKLVQGAPAAIGQMQVVVSPELAQVGVQATVTITQTAGAIQTVVIANAGFGYFTAGTAVTIAGGTGGTLDYTVLNGSLATVTLNAAGTGYTNSTQNIGDAPAATAPNESAKIINARTVKTFEGNIYMWPAAGGGGTTKVRNEADLGAAT